MRNRRATTRLLATEYRVWLGLWAGPDRFEAQAAKIENISLGGARIVVSSPPNSSQKVWLRVGTLACIDCIAGTVLDVERLTESNFAVRLAFETPCPRHLLQVVTESPIPAPHFRVPSRARAACSKTADATR